MKKRSRRLNLSQKITFGDRLAIGIIGVALLCDLVFPKIALAEEPTIIAEKPKDICITIPHAFYCGMEKSTFESPSLTISKDIPIETFWVLVTAYSSTPDQTDDTPFITAMGSHVRDGIVATNILKFRTYVKFPDEYGDKIFVVEDRMNRRYNDKKRMDIWMSTREEAIQFGARWLKAEVY